MSEPDFENIEKVPPTPSRYATAVNEFVELVVKGVELCHERRGVRRQANLLGNRLEELFVSLGDSVAADNVTALQVAIEEGGVTTVEAAQVLPECRQAMNDYKRFTNELRRRA